MFKNISPVLVGFSMLGLAAVMESPAIAGGAAYASGSSEIVLMNGASQSVKAEIVAPSGASFAAGVTVTPTLSGDLSTNTSVFSSLNVNPGSPIAAPPGTSFTAAAASALNAATTAGNLDAQVSIIQAGAGADGLD